MDNIKKKRPEFPLKRPPSSIVESRMYICISGAFPEEKDVHNLIQQMYHNSEWKYYYFCEKGKGYDTLFDAAIHRGDLAIAESQFYWYRPPETSHGTDFIQILNPEPELDWEKEVIKKSPMFVRSQFKLSNRKKTELDLWTKVQMEDVLRKQLQKQKYEYDVFLSYNISDNEIVSDIYSDIVAAGGRAFLAKKSIEPGEDFAEEIRHALVCSHEIWIVISPKSVESEWVISEWGAAWALKKRIIPILHRCPPESLPERLKRLQCIDLHRYPELIKKTFPQSHVEDSD